jgi:hypothetical protein
VKNSAKRRQKVNFLVIWSDFFVGRWSENPPTRVKSARKSESFGNFRGENGRFVFHFSRNGRVLDRNRAFSKKTKWIIGPKTRLVKKRTEFCREGNVGFCTNNGGPETKKWVALEENGRLSRREPLFLS